MTNTPMNKCAEITKRVDEGRTAALAQLIENRMRYSNVVGYVPTYWRCVLAATLNHFP